MGVQQYSLVAHDWINLEQIINDLARSVGQELSVISEPTFTGLTLSGLDASEFVFTNASKALVSVNVPLVVAHGGSGAVSLTDHSILLGSGTSAFTALGAATNGQLPIGSTGNDPVLAGLTGTSNQITVTNGAGSITLSTPQDIATSSSPTFTDLTLSAPSNIYSLSHDSFTDFTADEHFLQTAITNVSTALSTGLLKVTTGTGALSVIADNSSNWNIAYNDSPTAITFNTSDGIITLTQQDAGALTTVSLDGRYYTEAEIAAGYQPLDAGLTSLAGLTYVSDSFIKVTAEDTYAIRTIAETKSDLSLNLVENTALSTWAGTTNINTLGTITTGTWTGTTIAIANGGTGQTTQQAAIDALTNVSGATNEHVLTKDTATGNAIFKAAAGGTVGISGTPVQYDFAQFVNGTDIQGRSFSETLGDLGLTYFQKATTQTVNFTYDMTDSEIQALIDAVPKFVDAGVVITFQFGDGTYSSLTDTLDFSGFIGGGQVKIQGNTGEANATDLHTTQQVFLDYDGQGCTAITSYNNVCHILIQNLKIEFDQDTSAIDARNNSKIEVFYGYYLSDTTAGNTFGIYFDYCTFNAKENYLSNLGYGITGGHSLGTSDTNDDTGTQPKYGLYAYGATTIGKNSTQPSGSTADELTAQGGEIR